MTDTNEIDKALATILLALIDATSEYEDAETTEEAAHDEQKGDTNYRNYGDPDAAALDGITYAFRLAGLIDGDDYAKFIQTEMTDEGDWVNDVYVLTEDGKRIELGESIRVTPFDPANAVDDEDEYEDDHTGGLAEDDIVYIKKGTRSILGLAGYPVGRYGEVRGHEFLWDDVPVVNVRLYRANGFNNEETFTFPVSAVEFVRGADD